ncbi:MAG TPA: tetratricopeptide repeat protein [Tepidisphaeraceae bacterium]|jgi:tetratricopeptide (TPR) repeat protein|nr:tetratricopeptide repeat protein [Tepidisphaeraceae bacterium]
MQTCRARRDFLLPLLAAAFITAIYAAAAWSNQFIYDDHEVIENQFPIRHLNDLGRIFREPHYLNFPYYRPLTRATFAIQMSIWGRNPRPYHLFNAVLAGLVMLAAYALLRRSSPRVAWPAALIAACWFALHPAISECVYPAASGRETLLPALFILLATWAYLGRRRGSFWLAVGLFIIALLCKEQAVVLPGIFFLADILGLTGRRRSVFAYAGRYLLLATMLAIYFVVRHLVFGYSALHWAIAQHPLEPLKSLLYGLQTGVAPFMALRYEPPFDVWFDWRLCILACAAAVAIFAIAAFSGKAVRLAAIFWIGWFILLQLPTAHILEQEAAYSERYAALAILALPAVAAILFGPGAILARLRLPAAALSVLWIILFAGISFLRGCYYSNEFSFCEQWNNANPNAAGPHDGFGLIAQQRHQYSTAIAQYNKALAIEPNDATARNNLANILSETGDFAGASQQYEWLLHNNSSGADPAATMTNYAQLLAQEAWDYHDAAKRDRSHLLLEHAIMLRPDYAQAHYILGKWNEFFGSRTAAIRQFEIALDLRPDWPQARRQLEMLKSSNQPASRR